MADGVAIRVESVPFPEKAPFIQPYRGYKLSSEGGLAVKGDLGCDFAKIEGENAKVAIGLRGDTGIDWGKNGQQVYWFGLGGERSVEEDWISGEKKQVGWGFGFGFFRCNFGKSTFEKNTDLTTDAPAENPAQAVSKCCGC